MPLCNRCREEVAFANDLDRTGDIDRRRHVIRIGGRPRRLTPTFWRMFTLLYAQRTDVVDHDQLHAELHRDEEVPTSANLIRENIRRLRKVLAGSRYEIINHPTIRYEMIVAAADPED